jgi:hypothetical protein
MQYLEISANYHSLTIVAIFTLSVVESTHDGDFWELLKWFSSPK